MKHPSEDYDVATCRILQGFSREVFLAAHSGRDVTDGSLAMLGMWRNGSTDEGLPYQLIRNGEVVAQWAVIR